MGSLQTASNPTGILTAKANVQSAPAVLSVPCSNSCTHGSHTILIFYDIGSEMERHCYSLKVHSGDSCNCYHFNLHRKTIHCVHLSPASLYIHGQTPTSDFPFSFLKVTALASSEGEED